MRPSKQIRAPLYSTKQKRQRRWIVSALRDLNDVSLIAPKDHQVHPPLHYSRGRSCLVDRFA